MSKFGLFNEEYLSLATLNLYQSAQFLLTHLKNAYLQKAGVLKSKAPDFEINENEDFWLPIIENQRSAFRHVTLKNFKIVDWYPRSPGLYHTREARMLREHSHDYLIEVNGIKFLEPRGKLHMIEGGTGSVRFKPLRIENEDSWLCTATSDDYCHSGIPLAIPDRIMQSIDTNFRFKYIIDGRVKFLPEFITKEHFRHWTNIPQLYIEVDKVQEAGKNQSDDVVRISPMVFFNSDSIKINLDADPYETKAQVTYATCAANKVDEINKASEWLDWYIKRYSGEVLTNFDQQRPIFENAPFSLQKVMLGRIDKSDLQVFKIKHAEIITNEINKIHSEETTVNDFDITFGDNATFHGDFVVANKIKNSFNKAADSNAPDELKELLKQLSVEVARMAKELPKEDAEQTARDLDSLVQEATGKKPRQPIWETFLTSITETAKTVGTVGKPVLDLALLISPYLIKAFGA